MQDNAFDGVHDADSKRTVLALTRGPPSSGCLASATSFHCIRGASSNLAIVTSSPTVRHTARRKLVSAPKPTTELCIAALHRFTARALCLRALQEVSTMDCMHSRPAIC